MDRPEESWLNHFMNITNSGEGAIKTVYIAGPLTPASTTQNHAIEYLVNVRNMVLAGRRLLVAGFYPFVPAFDFLFFMLPPDEGKYCQEPLEISGTQIKEYSMGWLRRCDAVLFLPGWSKSKGAVAEYFEAKSMGIPTLFDIEDLLREAPNAVS
ncbi:MAG: DUF4406 domain-containing protein [Thermoplasmata archaeon]|nr:DUF4406 domain-containing protein [Thermoplasmata archaeon]